MKYCLLHVFLLLVNNPQEQIARLKGAFLSLIIKQLNLYATDIQLIQSMKKTNQDVSLQNDTTAFTIIGLFFKNKFNC